MDILRNISLNEILLIYLVYSIFNDNNSSYVKANYEITSSDDDADEKDTKDIKNIKHHRALLNKQLFSNNFNIHNARKRLKYVDNYFSHAEKIKNRAMHIKKDGKQGTNKFLMDNLKHGLGDDFKSIESIMSMLPLLSSMNEIKDVFTSSSQNSHSDEDIKEVVSTTPIKQLNNTEKTIKENNRELTNNLTKRDLKEDKSYNDILELVNLLS